MDRTYNDYLAFGEMTERNIWFVAHIKSNAVYGVEENLVVPQNSNIDSCNNLKFEATTIAAKTKIYCALCAIVLMNNLKSVSDS